MSVAETELQRISEYLALIGVPAQRSVRSDYPAGMRDPLEHQLDPDRIANGAALFERSGCTACHTPTLKSGSTYPFAELRDQTIHPYTDLLLHDMGPGLADILAEGRASPERWRTPPLWGLS